MPMCQAYGCSKKPNDHEKKSFFAIPNPDKERERCVKWLNNIGTDKFDIRTYKYVKNRVVCEDHFEQDCFQDVRAKVMGYEPKKKLLKPDAIPTIFFHCPQAQSSERKSTIKRCREKSDLQQVGIFVMQCYS